MTERKHFCLAKTVACFLAIVLMIPFGANAAVPKTVAPCASDYLASYTSYICHMGGGDLEIWYRVTGVGEWADIGVLSIQLFESTDQVKWTRVTTFEHYKYDTMLGHNTGHHMSHVDYEGSTGKYYKAYVCIWAGDGTNGDARYFWTDVEYASPLDP